MVRSTSTRAEPQGRDSPGSSHSPLATAWQRKTGLGGPWRVIHSPLTSQSPRWPLRAPPLRSQVTLIPSTRAPPWAREPRAQWETLALETWALSKLEPNIYMRKTLTFSALSSGCSLSRAQHDSLANTKGAGYTGPGGQIAPWGGGSHAAAQTPGHLPVTGSATAPVQVQPSAMWPQAQGPRIQKPRG